MICPNKGGIPTLSEYIDMLFKKVVGEVGIDPATFFDLSVEECHLIINGYRNRLKDNFYYNQLAMYNAVGSHLQGKKFKIIDPFDEKSKKPKIQKVDKNKRKSDLDYLLNLR